MKIANWLVKSMIFHALLVVFFGCTHKMVAINSKSLNEKNCTKLDTIEIENSMGFSLNRVALRIYPDSCLSDFDALKEAKKNDIYGVYEVGRDSILVFLDRPIFSYGLVENKTLSNLSESVINRYLDYFKIGSDPDPPFWVAYTNTKDSVIMSYEEEEELVYACITDTILKLGPFMPMHISKESFFNKLGIPYDTEKQDFTVLLSSTFCPEKSWFKPLMDHEYNQKHMKSSFHSNYIVYVLSFSSGELSKIILW